MAFGPPGGGQVARVLESKARGWFAQPRALLYLGIHCSPRRRDLDYEPSDIALHSAICCALCSLFNLMLVGFVVLAIVVGLTF